MNSYEINPYVRLGMRHVWKEPNISSRIILDYELIYCEEGMCFLQYNGVNYTISRGDFVLLCPGVEHSFINAGRPFTQPHIHFDIQYDSTSDLVFICRKNKKQLTPQELRLLRHNVFGEQSPILRINDKERFLKLFYETIDTYLTSNLTARANMIYLLSMIEQDNFPGTFDNKLSTNSICSYIKAYICDNLSNPLHLEDMEKHFNYSKFYLSRIFKKEYGLPIMAFWREKRMELAKQLLESYSITSVCEQMQFSSVCAFSHAFKDAYGINPSDYQKKQKVHKS